MENTIFSELKFWLMMIASIVMPFGIYSYLILKKAISQKTTLAFGFALVAIAGMDVYFLKVLSAAAKLSPSPADDTIFVSEISLALYLVPAMFGGIGVNIISHVLIKHLDQANQRFKKEHPES
ncbi:hypothetical protein ACO0LG_12430 [Undibacterium sp. Ji42W]|uniref:hypothetical protein n=1 Tax=Undibacterium sp. Ji42W TaxID=3413039 RepID=UPI003BF29E2E